VSRFHESRVRRTNMADSYLQFSEMLILSSKEERSWVEQFIDNPPKDFLTKYDCLEYLPFSAELEKEGLWIYSEDYGNPDAICDFVQQFLAKFAPDKCWTLHYAYTCSKLRVGEFGGGTVLVTAAEIMYSDDLIRKLIQDSSLEHI